MNKYVSINMSVLFKIVFVWLGIQGTWYVSPEWTFELRVDGSEPGASSILMNIYQKGLEQIDWNPPSILNGHIHSSSHRSFYTLIQQIVRHRHLLDSVNNVDSDYVILCPLQRGQREPFWVKLRSWHQDYVEFHSHIGCENLKSENHQHGVKPRVKPRSWELELQQIK